MTRRERHLLFRDDFGIAMGAYMVKCRARAYRARPAELETISPGLSFARPARLIAEGEHALEFRGETPPISAKACILLGRYRRMEEIAWTTETEQVKS